MNYLSVCSGVEAASVAWKDLGFNPVAFSEIESFPSAVLSQHYPSVPNVGDMTKYKEWNLNGTINLLVGGTPCQSFSVAGLRKGLEDPRGNLMLTYVGILDKFRPKWCVWENVPGVLSSNGGRDFGSFLGALVELGYGFAYRVLDAQNFGVPQRRRRVFVVGCLGSWEDPAKVLFESDCLSGDNKKSRKAGKEVTSYTPSGFGKYSEGVGTLRRAGGDLGGGSEVLVTAYGGSDPDCADTVTRKWYKGSGGPSGNECGLFVAQTHVYETHPADSRVKEMGDVCQTVTSRWGTGGGNTPIAVKSFGWQNSSHQSMTVDNITPTLDKSKTPAVAYSTPQAVDVYNQAIDGQVSATLTKACGGTNTSGPKIMQDPTYSLQGAGATSQNANGSGWNEEKSFTLNITDVHGVANNMKVRKLTPRECERLQGFPDDYTNIPWKGKEESPDGHRYKAMGNSMAVPVMKWIGERIKNVELS